jgi:cytochrome c biogenesis protein CcmG/thiol:disulfide interchange protein DsbE
MAFISRRFFVFATAIISGLALLAVLLLLFAQPPQPVSPTSPPPTPTPQVVATVDDEPIHLDEWQKAVALDQAMSELLGQIPPNPEETLNRLINERLVLQAAEKIKLPKADQTRAEAWLAGFLASSNVEDITLAQTLNRFGLTRAELVGEIVPRLLQVEQALAELPPDGNGEAWVADLRSQARVALLENLSVLVLPDQPNSAATELPTLSAPDQQQPPVTRLTAGPGAGEFAPDFSLETIDGTTVNLSGLRGKPIQLNFWALWCTPCLEELAMLQTVDNNELVILSIAVNVPPEEVIGFAADRGVTLPLLLDRDGRASTAYRVHGLPTSLFIDRDGVIIGRHVGPLDQATLDSYLDALLVHPAAPAPAP